MKKCLFIFAVLSFFNFSYLLSGIRWDIVEGLGVWNYYFVEKIGGINFYKYELAKIYPGVIRKLVKIKRYYRNIYDENFDMSKLDKQIEDIEFKENVLKKEIKLKYYEILLEKSKVAADGWLKVKKYYIEKFDKEKKRLREKVIAYEVIKKHLLPGEIVDELKKQLLIAFSKKVDLILFGKSSFLWQDEKVVMKEFEFTKLEKKGWVDTRYYTKKFLEVLWNKNKEYFRKNIVPILNRIFEGN